jgi:glycosyltransferase involved in cell wall biosynthesis
MGRVVVDGLAGLGDNRNGRPELAAISVVIAAFNGERFLGTQLEALSYQQLAGGFEVIVADNGSTDSTVEIARSFIPRLDLSVVDASTIRGQAFARNIGAGYARGESLIFLDQDDMVAPGYLVAMAQALDQGPLVAARMEIGELNPGWIRQAREIVQTVQLPEDPVPWGYGCTLGVCKQVFLDAGGFDTSLPYAAEDVDLCIRLHDRGVTMRFVDDAVLHYRFPDTFRALFRQGRRYGAAGVAVQRKHSTRPQTLSRWLRGMLGAIRWATLGEERGVRARGLFVLGRRVGEVQGVITFHLGKARRRTISRRK